MQEKTPGKTEGQRVSPRLKLLRLKVHKLSKETDKHTDTETGGREEEV